MVRSFALYLLFIALIALVPASIHRTDDSVSLRVPQLGNRVIDTYVHPDVGEQKVREKLPLLKALDTYSIGATEHRLSRTLPRYFFWSAGALFLGLTVAFVAGLLVFLYLVYRERFGLLDRIQHIAVLPTFVVVIALQEAALALNSGFGIHIRIAAGRDPAILIPIIALSLIPGAFIIRTLASSIEDSGLATSLWAAKARGIPRAGLLRRHLLAAGLDAVNRNRVGLFTYLFANLLITERLCNLPGITRALFGYGFIIRTVRSTDIDGAWGFVGRVYEVQVNLLIFGMLGLALAYLLVLGLFNLLHYLSRRTLIGE